MKNLLLSMSIMAALFSACKKETADEATPAGDVNGQKQIAGINQLVPSVFTKKAFIESFTGASYNKCPETDALVENMIVNNPNRVVAVAVHEGDKMETLFNQTIHSVFNNGSTPAVPSYMINRIPVANQVFLNSHQMQGFTNKGFNMTATCGLAINSTVAGRKVLVTVHAGFNQALTGNHHLSVCLTENQVSGLGKGYDQLNTYNTVPSSTYYNQGDPIVGYKHDHVLRKMLTADLGNMIDPSKLTPGGHEIQNFQVDIPYDWDLNRLYVVAYINRVGMNPITHEVLNAQTAKLGTLKNWD